MQQTNTPLYVDKLECIEVSTFKETEYETNLANRIIPYAHNNDLVIVEHNKPASEVSTFSTRSLAQMELLWPILHNKPYGQIFLLQLPVGIQNKT